MSDLTKFDPFAQMQALQKQFFDEDWFSPSKSLAMPTTDVYTKDDKELTVEAHLPNFEEKDIDIQVDKGWLVIQAEKHEEEKDKKKKYVIRESNSSFYRRIRLPEIANENKIEATMNNGLLTVTVPFKNLPAPKRISIKSKG